jgi:hypothetical protein
VKTPRLALTITALQRLGGNAALIEQHASQIHYAMLHLIATYRACGFDIGRDADGFYARPRPRTAGLRRELDALAAKCRKAVTRKIGNERWITTWAALPVRTAELWKPVLIRTVEGRTIDRDTLAGGFEAEGFAMLAPKPEVVRPRIELELARTIASPRPKKRERNADETRAIEVITNAYREITGNSRKRVVRNGRAAGGRIQFGREIDAIYGTTLFSVKDSTRLR